MIAQERRAPIVGEAPSKAPSEEDESEQAIDHALVCVACEHPITKDAEATEAFGGHVHDRVNPAGVAFRIGLFSRADGAALVGPSSDEFPWFPHCRWRIALCGGCFTHVGWLFTPSGVNHAQDSPAPQEKGARSAPSPSAHRAGESSSGSTAFYGLNLEALVPK